MKWRTQPFQMLTAVPWWSASRVYRIRCILSPSELHVIASSFVWWVFSPFTWKNINISSTTNRFSSSLLLMSLNHLICYAQYDILSHFTVEGLGSVSGRYSHSDSWHLVTEVDIMDRVFLQDNFCMTITQTSYSTCIITDPLGVSNLCQISQFSFTETWYLGSQYLLL